MGKHKRDRQRRRRADNQFAVGQVVIAAATAWSRGRHDDARALVGRLAQRAEAGAGGGAELSRVLGHLLVAAVAGCWRLGWQPADLVHVVGRELRAINRRMCADAVQLDAQKYRYATGADPGWLAQVDAVTGDGEPPETAELLDTWGASAGSVREALHAAVETLALLQGVPPQPRLCPPPSDWGPTARVRSTGRATDPKITERVRALLAKAESTEFPDEAEAFTAKAQELIARHAIDLAMLDAGPSTGEIIGRRLLIDDPYSRAKSILVGVIAQANRCRAVFSEGLGSSTVFGAPSDVDSVELLYTSLLTQATGAMAAAGRSGGARSRARPFRQSFLVAFSYRIGERLKEATSVAVDEALTRHGDNVLPVLASRDAAAEDARDAAFPELRTQRISTSSYDGWVAGRSAADHARLGPEGALRAG